MNKTFSASLALDLLSMGYILEKYPLFANTWAYLLPSSDTQLSSKVSVDHFPSIVLRRNIRSAQYLIDNGKRSLRRRFYVVFFNVLVAWFKLIIHCSLKS